MVSVSSLSVLAVPYRKIITEKSFVIRKRQIEKAAAPVSERVRTEKNRGRKGFLPRSRDSRRILQIA
jgi:hypothetical protein